MVTHARTAAHVVASFREPAPEECRSAGMTTSALRASVAPGAARRRRSVTSWIVSSETIAPPPARLADRGPVRADLPARAGAE